MSLTVPGKVRATSGNQEMNLTNGEPLRGGTWARVMVPGDCSQLWARGPGNCSVESVSRVRPRNLEVYLRELKGRLTDQHIRT